jgi:mono/diheme cytochrome c family protein
MPTPGLSQAERTALTAFMLSLQQRDLPRSYLSPRKHLAYYRQADPEPRTAAQLYGTFCSSCHDTGGFGRWDKLFARFIPAIRAPAYRRQADAAYVAANIRDGRQGTPMTSFGPAAGGLSEEEIRLLTGYLLGRDVQLAEIAPREGERVHARAQAGSTARGAALFARECSGCHGLAAEGKAGPSLIAPVFQRMAGDEFLFATIAEGRTNTAMPAFLAPGRGGLGEQDIHDLIAWLRSLGQPQSERVAALTAAAVSTREGR